MFGSIINSLSGIGSKFADKSEGRKIRRENADLQREFAQSGISWKVDDAYRRKDLIHPLVSMGAQTHSATGSNVGMPSSPMPDIGRGIDESISRIKDRAYMAKRKRLEIERMELENERIRKETNNIGLNTDPINKPKVETQPAQVTAKKTTGITAGIHALYDHYDDDKGRLHLVFNEKAGESMDADTVAKWKASGFKIKDLAQNINTGRGLNIKKLRQLHHELIRFRNILPNPGNGKTWKYNTKIASWQKVYGKKDKNLFLDKRLNNHLHNYHRIPNPWKKNKTSNPNYRRYR